MTSFLDNAWQMAAWSEEIGESLLSRGLAGRKLLLLRGSAGEVAIMDDRCPHRFAPLSMGEREGDTIVCGYHGLTFDTGGNCVRNPFSNRIPAGATVPTYLAVERDGIVWVWLGDPAAADAGAIPDFSFLPDSATNRTVRGYTLLQANFEYGTDNLMDLSHIEFVHKGSFAGQGVIFAGQHEVIQDGDMLHSNWWMPDVAAPPHTAGAYPPGMRTDHWLDMRWQAPASMYLQIGAAPVGAPRDTGIIADQAHILTPETEATTHYFWASTRANALDDEGMDAMLKSLFAQAFDEEDKPMIKAAYDNMEGEDFWARRPVFLGIDAGGTRARRLLETMRAAERAPSLAASA
jgi:vanillate O-demethylase monooxygenase subunit